MQQIKAIVETTLYAMGGTLLGGVTGWFLGNTVGAEAVLERMLLFWGGILLGTLLAFWLTVNWIGSTSLGWLSTILVATLALLLSAIALGIYTGPLQRFVPMWILANEVSFWLPFVPVVAPLIAVMVVGACLPYERH